MFCRICLSEGNGELYKIREMMFGLRTEFSYYECPQCGALQIESFPTDIAQYYPPTYYSFTEEVKPLNRSRLQPFKLAVNLWLGRSRNLRLGNWLVNCKATSSSRILDVGCGRGVILSQLYNMGFTNLEGVDKYLPQPIEYANGFRIDKCDISELPESRYDVVMMNHVLEHMEDQQETMKQCLRILKPKGFLLVRIPVKTAAWVLYKTDWVQLDAPRHYYIHTIKSFETLAEKNGFTITRREFDSKALQFWGSEMYQRDLPLMSIDAYEIESGLKVFTKEEIMSFEKKAEAFNQQGIGDQIVFYLTKSTGRNV